MIQHKETYYSKLSIQQLFDLVIDIEKYPEFIPWCSDAKILDRPQKNILIAELIVKFSGMSEQYTSRVELSPLEHNRASINTFIVSGPFKQLHSSWIFSSETKRTKVEFYIEFEFASKLLQMMIGKVFEKASVAMINAFEQRAKEIY